MGKLPAWGSRAVSGERLLYRPSTYVKMSRRNLHDRTLVETKRRGSRAWLFGAYTFLFIWGMAYLVLYFTDRLPF